jgi:predicted dehydrogenase
MQGDLAEAKAEEFGCLSYTDYNEMVENKDIDAVCVVTPTHLHVEPVAAVVGAGKALFCEKPLAHNMDDTLKLARLIKEAGILCQMGFMSRYDPPYMEAEQMVKDGVIGKPVYYGGFSRDPFPPVPWACDLKKGGGLLSDVLVHDADRARFLMMDEVSRVYATEANLVADSEGVERFADNCTVNITFKSGALGNVHLSMNAAYGFDHRTEVFGSDGRIMIGGISAVDVTVCTQDRGCSQPKTFMPKGEMPPFMFRFGEAYANELTEFVDCVLENRTPRCSEDDAVAAYKICMAAVKSAGEKKPVDLE